MTLQDQVKQHRAEIKHESLTYPISQFIAMYESQPREMEIAPDFQRLFRWSRQRQSDFIESLILEIPIPSLFFYERDDGVWELLDGLQRFSTIIRFFCKAAIPQDARGRDGNDSDWHEINANNLETALQLSGGEYLTELDGLTMSTLPTNLQLNLKRARLQITVLKRETDRRYKYAVFERLNKGGVQIEPQEIRNCSVRMLGAEFPNYIQQLARNEEFLKCVDLNDNNLRKGYGDELVLRFFAVKNFRDNFKHDVEEFLTRYMKAVARGDQPFSFDEEGAVFNEVWALLGAAFEKGDVFKAKTEDGRNIGPFSPALYEMITYGMACHYERAKILDPSQLRQKIVDFIREAKSRNLTGGGSNSRRKFLGRLAFADEEFAK
jgi:hypothetical protein